MEANPGTTESRDSYARFNPEWGAHPIPPVPDTPIHKIVGDNARKYPDKVALICLGRKMGYRELDDLSSRLAFVLTNRFGVTKGDRVAIMQPNSIQHLIVFLAVNKLGATYSPVNVMYTPRELEYQLDDCGAKVFVSLDKFYPRMEEIRDRTSVEHVILTNIEDFALLKDEVPERLKEERKEIPGTYQLLSLLEEPAGELPEVEIDPSEDLAFLWYTAGTTGVSKGVMITHKGFMTATHNAPFVLGLTESDVLLNIFPRFHCGGWLVESFPILYAGGTVVEVPLFDARKCLEWIERYGVSVIFAPPTLYSSLLNQPDFGEYDLSSLRITSSNGAPQPAALRDTWKSMTGLTLIQGYGLTETSCQGSATMLMPNKHKDGSVGVPFCCEIKIVDDEGQVVPRGVVGEILFRSEANARGYWNKPEMTRETFQEDGWLRTGDAAHMDEEDFVHFTERYKDLIIASGYNIAPTEVEGVLLQHPAVREAGVVGIPDEYRGETVKAFVSLHAGHEGTTPDELIAHCRRVLAAFKIPRAIQFIDEVPKNPAGKTLRRRLRELSE